MTLKLILILQEEFAKLTIYTRGCIGALMVIFKDHLIIVGLIAFAVGFLQVAYFTSLVLVPLFPL